MLSSEENKPFSSLSSMGVGELFIVEMSVSVNECVRYHLLVDGFLTSFTEPFVYPPLTILRYTPEPLFFLNSVIGFFMCVSVSVSVFS